MFVKQFDLVTLNIVLKGNIYMFDVSNHYALLLNTLVIKSHVLVNNYFIPNLFDQQFHFCRSLRDAFQNEKFENYTYGYNFVPRSIVNIVLSLICSRYSYGRGFPMTTTFTTEPVFVGLLRSPGIDSQPGEPVQKPFQSYRPARLHRLTASIPWNRFLGSINVY